ncbi:AbfB domain-containing protein [Renibacterium salmoninarum]|nr:AbfB domain-containing protein [Renibacterium salmoninarum]
MNPASDKDLCVTYFAPEPRTADHTAYKEKCDKSYKANSQRFELIERGLATYLIKDWNGRQCLTNTNGKFVVQAVCDENSNAQKWEFVPGANDSRYIKNVANGKVLDLEGNNLIQTDLNTESTNQRWAVTKESKALYNLSALGSYVSVQTTAPGTPQSIRHTNGVGQVALITTNSPELDRKSSTWKIVPGLYDKTCISFQSLNFPQQYLSARDVNVATRGTDASVGGLLPGEGTFCPRVGSTPDTMSFDWSGNQGYALQNVG